MIPDTASPLPISPQQLISMLEAMMHRQQVRKQAAAGEARRSRRSAAFFPSPDSCVSFEPTILRMR